MGALPQGRRSAESPRVSCDTLRGQIRCSASLGQQRLSRCGISPKEHGMPVVGVALQEEGKRNDRDYEASPLALDSAIHRPN